MKKTITGVGIVVVAVLMTACSLSYTEEFGKDDSPKTKSVRNVEPFTKICLDATCDVYFMQGDSISVVVEGRQNAVNQLVTAVDKGNLRIKSSNGINSIITRKFISDNVKVYVTAPVIGSISVKGCGDFNVERRLDADTLKVSLSGVGDINIAGVVCEVIDVGVTGTGDVNVKNLACEKSRISLSGVGDININEIEVADTEISMHGVGDIKVHFQDCGHAVCNLSGVGDISLKGNLRNFEKKRHGVGEINTAGLKVGK